MPAGAGGSPGKEPPPPHCRSLRERADPWGSDNRARPVLIPAQEADTTGSPRHGGFRRAGFQEPGGCSHPGSASPQPARQRRRSEQQGPRAHGGSFDRGPAHGMAATRSGPCSPDRSVAEGDRAGFRFEASEGHGGWGDGGRSPAPGREAAPAQGPLRAGARRRRPRAGRTQSTALGAGTSARPPRHQRHPHQRGGGALLWSHGTGRSGSVGPQPPRDARRETPVPPRRATPGEEVAGHREEHACWP